jgi:hypothetical protein
MRKSTKKSFKAQILALAVLGAASAAQAGTTTGAVTITLSGSTAMRNFTISNAFSLLTPGTSITIGEGANAYTIVAANGAGTAIQLAPSDPTAGVNLAGGSTTTYTGSATVNAFRVEWHEQGSVEGIVDLADSQIDDNIQLNSAYNASSATAVFVNRNKWGGTSPVGATSGTPLNNTTYTAFASDTDRTNPSALTNLSRVQMAISDVNAKQGFSVSSGTNVQTAGNPFSKPGDTGYGKGNAALGSINVTDPRNLGTTNTRRALRDQTTLNMSTDKTNYQTGTNYIAGPWNTAGLGNVQSTPVAITATGLVANPGTGLVEVNRTDAQFLQAAGRLSNGADFNVATRDVNSGTLNVAALNVGLDPSFAVGENDSGTGGGTSEDTINVAGMKFTGKNSGGSNLRPTVQNNRMAFGHLSLSDSRSGNANDGSRPLRTLYYNDTANGSGSGYLPDLDNITSGNYKLWQQEQYITVKQISPANSGLSVSAWSALSDSTTGIRGDNTGNDVADYRQNILGSISPTVYNNLNSAANPADGLVNTGFVLPQYMAVSKDVDGGATTPRTQASDYSTFRSFQATNYTINNSGSSLTSLSPDRIKSGTSAYGNVASGIPITAPTANTGNWLFGNFNQNGIRDLAAVKSALAAQAALQASGYGTNWGTGALLNASNNSNVSYGSVTTLTKGDLIVMGDYNGDGAFDGRDLQAIARGTALVTTYGNDNATSYVKAGGTNSITGADSFGAGIAYLKLAKNAALDYYDTNATATQKAQATNNLANDPTGSNAFNKFDTNRDGILSIADAFVIDRFNGSAINDLVAQLGATVNTATNAFDAGTPGSLRSISLVDVKVTDSDAAIGAADAAAISSSNRGLNGSVQTYTWSGSTVKPGSLSFTIAPAAGSAITANPGSSFTIAAGSITATGSAFGSGNLAIINNGRLSVTNGLSVASLTGTGSTTVSGSGSLTYAATGTGSNYGTALTFSDLTVSNGFNVTLAKRAANTFGTVSVLNSISASAGSTIDATTNIIVLRNQSVSSVQSLLTSGALTTSVTLPDNDNQATRGLAVFSNDAGGGVPYFTNVGQIYGLNLSTAALLATDTIVAYAKIGDVNLDNKVDGQDFKIIMQYAISGGGTNWLQGDINNSGTVDAADLLLFNREVGGLGFGASDDIDSAVALAASGGTSSIPEPSALGLLAAAMPLVSRRRRVSK